MSEILQITFIVSLLAGMFRMAAPILYSALGELVCERSGVLNLGIEGVMTIGGFAGYLATYHTGSPWIGVLWSVYCRSRDKRLDGFYCRNIKSRSNDCWIDC